jgi:hypothetical protein
MWEPEDINWKRRLLKSLLGLTNPSKKKTTRTTTKKKLPFQIEKRDSISIIYCTTQKIRHAIKRPWSVQGMKLVKHASLVCRCAKQGERDLLRVVPPFCQEAEVKSDSLSKRTKRD